MLASAKMRQELVQHQGWLLGMRVGGGLILCGCGFRFERGLRVGRTYRDPSSLLPFWTDPDFSNRSKQFDIA
jgi:hypothetical protein